VVRRGAIPPHHVFNEDREDIKMEFYSPVYQLLYTLEQSGKVRTLRAFDCMHEYDILAYIEGRLAMIA